MPAPPVTGRVEGTGDALVRRPRPKKGVVVMFARTTTVNIRPQEVDEAIRVVRDDLMDPVQRLRGNIGLSMLADRRSGRCILTSAWSDENALLDSADAIAPLRERLAALGNGPTMVQQWEIAVVHRRRNARDGASARVSWLQGEPSRADRGIEVYRSTVLSALDRIPGFCSASLLIDRASGRSVSSVAYENQELLEASRPSANALRERSVELIGATVVEVAEFELAVSHLRVPETV